MTGAFHDGIIIINALEKEIARGYFHSLADAKWQQARVAQKYDGLRIKEIVDKESRNALSVHPDFVLEKTNLLITKVYPQSIDAVKFYWDIDIGNWSSPQFTLYKEGHFIKAHRDSGDAYPNRLFTVVVYLTDDYSGGEIRFPSTQSKFHPSAGQALIFPADFVHDVKAIESGIKCVFLFFLDA